MKGILQAWGPPVKMRALIVLSVEEKRKALGILAQRPGSSAKGKVKRNTSRSWSFSTFAAHLD